MRPAITAWHGSCIVILIERKRPIGNGHEPKTKEYPCIMTIEKYGNILVVLDGRDYHGLIRSLSRWGYSTIVVDNQFKALDQIDHHNIVAVVVEDQGSVDSVEFVLSVRDAHDELPIIIIRSPKNQYIENIIGKKPDVFFVSADEDSLRPEMHAVLDASGR